MNKVKKVARLVFGKKAVGKKEFGLDLKKLISYKQQVPLHFYR